MGSWLVCTKGEVVDEGWSCTWRGEKRTLCHGRVWSLKGCSMLSLDGKDNGRRLVILARWHQGFLGKYSSAAPLTAPPPRLAVREF